MRKEAAILLGAVGTALVTALQIILGTADVSSLAPAIETILTSAAPLIVGYATRGVVYAKATVEELQARAQVADQILGAGNTETLVSLLKERGEAVLKRAIEEGVAIAQRNVR